MKGGRRGEDRERDVVIVGLPCEKYQHPVQYTPSKSSKVWPSSRLESSRIVASPAKYHIIKDVKNKNADPTGLSLK